MRKLMLAALLAVAAPAAAAQKSFPAGGFDKVDLAAAATVDVHAGARFAVRAEGDQRLLDRLNVRVENGTLVIGWLPGSSMTMARRDNIRVFVAMPGVSGVSVSGAGTIAVDRADAPAFAATVGGAGTVNLPALHARQATLNVGGAGQIVAAGSVGQINARVGGVGAIDAAALAARAGRFDMSGTGSITARVDGPADVHVSGFGSVRVLGRARCEIHKSGFSSVHCGA